MKTMTKIIFYSCCILFQNICAMMNTCERLEGFRDRWYAKLAQQKEVEEEHLAIQLAKVQQEIEDLKLENSHLKKLLQEHGISYKKSGEEPDEQKCHVNHVGE